LIIIDDASTDGSAAVLKSFTDDRIRLLKNGENKGIVYSRNLGLGEARGSFIAQFDSDDVAMPDKFEKQIAFLKKNPDFGMVGSSVRMIDSNGKMMKDKWKLTAKPSLIPSIMLFRNYFVQSAIVARREAIPNGGYRPGYDVVEDYKMWIEIARKFKVWNLPEYLVKYRVHETSATNSDSRRLDEQHKLIFGDLFDDLKININKQNFETHLIIKQSGPINDIEVLRQIEGHLKLLISQNSLTKVYDGQALEKVVFNRWVKSCIRARTAGIKVAGIFISSPLSLKFIA
jgi:glycosyltransferase involved in cell wall biosynthesis